MITNESRYAQLENELDTLDVPASSLDVIVDAVAVTLDLDPIDQVRRVIDDNDPHPVISAVLLEGIESSTQLPHILRALEIGTEMLELES